MSSASSVDQAFSGFRQAIDAAFDRHILANAPVALLQFPYDGNVGNHMMWVAITDYLEERGIPVAYAAHGMNFNLDELARAIGGGTILFLGGVTVSRLWPRHAEVKREVARRFPNNPLISLPSTMLFVDDEDRAEAGAIFGRHERALVMARDPLSAESARGVFPDTVQVVAMPDSALRLKEQPQRGRPEHDVIWLARDDKEGAGFTPPASVHVFDWPHDLRAKTPAAYLSLRMSGVFSNLRSSALGALSTSWVNPPISALYRRASQQILDYGNRILDKGRVLVTDRMHPHILAALRDQDVVLLADRFGKNKAVYQHSTHTLTRVRWAETPAEAYEIASQLARSSR